MTETLIDRIVEEVLVRIDQKDVSEKEALLVYTGGTMGRAAGIRAAENLKRGGWKIEIVVTEAARQIGTLDLLPDGAESMDNNFKSVKPFAMEHNRILVPVMTVTTASKIAKMIWDTPASYLIGSALSQGKEVWVARDACDFSLRKKAPVAMKEMSQRVLNTLESFGVRWCKSDELYRDLIFAKAENPKQAYMPAQPDHVEALPELCRIARIDKRVITRGDVMPYLSGMEQIQIPKGSILTALAEEEIKKHQIPWIWVDGGMK
jgi:3-polyprenyl-4-hydroxybenzoate decarboxylase